MNIMRGRLIQLFLVFLCLSFYESAFSQEKADSTKSIRSVLDSLRKSGIILYDNQTKPEIELSNSQAIKFLQQKFQPQFWNDPENPFRHALEQLVFEASHPVYDSTEFLLKNYPYDSLKI